MSRAKVGCLIFVVSVSVPVLLFVARSGWNLYQNVDISRKYDFAMEQCEKYGGQQGELPIVTEGVFDSKRVARRNDILQRASIFINNGLKYVEFSSNVITLTGSVSVEKMPLFMKDNGKTYFKYYRAYVTEKGDPLCEPYESIQALYKYYDQEILSDKVCIAIEGFDESYRLKAPYQLTVADKHINEGVEVVWNNLLVIERRSQKVVASYNSFFHCLTNMKTHASEGFGYCRGSYSNEKAWPSCPGTIPERVKDLKQFEQSAFTYEGN